jgi:hypothetical protein
MIRIKPVCKFNFTAKTFLQGKNYKIINESYDIDGKTIKSILSVDKNLNVTNGTSGYTFKSIDNGYKVFNFEVISDNGLKSFCSKRINIKEYDIRLSNLHINMLSNKFKEYIKNTYGKIEVEYPNSFLNSMLDSRKAYAFDKYYGLFVHNKLQCLVSDKLFNKKQLSCSNYKNKIKLDD